MADIKLVASDMDLTLLTSKSELPPKFGETIQRMFDNQVDFAIASGRPIYTLKALFPNYQSKMGFICDNGGLVNYQGQTLYHSLLPVDEYQKMIKFVEEETTGVAILCTTHSAYITSDNVQYEEGFGNFYKNITVVDSMRDLSLDADKFTIYFPENDSKENFDKIFAPEFGDDFSVVVSGKPWLDIMNKNIDKGVGIRKLGEYLGIDASNMMAFGDTYNDIEMLQSVDYSYLMANAEDHMKQYANYLTETNDQFGVPNQINRMLDQK